MLSRALIVLAMSTAFVSAASAESMTDKQLAETRAKVQTALELARIAEKAGDGDALLVAARLLSTVGPVAMTAAKGAERPAMVDVKKMAARAKELGADPAKADRLTVQPLANTPGFWQPDYCPAGYNCTSTWVY